MAGRLQANTARLASRAEVPICFFPNQFGWFFARITFPEAHISNPSPLLLGSVLKSHYFKECAATLLWSTSIILIGYLVYGAMAQQKGNGRPLLCTMSGVGRRTQISCLYPGTGCR